MSQLNISKQIKYATLAFTAGTFLTLNLWAITPELQKDYTEFKQQYKEALNTTSNKTEFLKNFKSLEKKLQGQYTNFEKKEGSAITDEGNQMALDVEMLEPLKIIAEGQASKESCSNAEFINELNYSSDASTYGQLKEKIKKLCQ